MLASDRAPTFDVAFVGRLCAQLREMIHDTRSVLVDRRLLGLSCGAPMASAEILLNAALDGAEAAGATVEVVRTGDLDLSKPETAHGAWVWEKLLACDALIVS